MYMNSIPIILTGLFLMILTSNLFGAPPTKEVLQKFKDEGRLEQFVETMRDARSRGVNSIVSNFGKGGVALKSTPDEPFRVVVLLIDYPDQLYTEGEFAAVPNDIDSVLFSDNLNPTGSMKEYYIENSYGQFVLQGDIFGWYRAPESYKYYVNFCDGSLGHGDYPNNGQKLVEEAILAADADIDFSLYDNNGDGYVDGLFVIHSGGGRETSGGSCDMWSHAWGLYEHELLVDGVRIQNYLMVPEEAYSGVSPIGVICHEYGHVLGLPDLYDPDFSTDGLGQWAMMSHGLYLGSAQTPSQFICWSKYKLGWLDPINVASNMTDVAIPAVENNPVVYRFWRDGSVGDEYFMVENRQRILYDKYIPGDGLLVWHIDESVWGVADEWHPQVMLEQADGRYDMQTQPGYGNPEDAFPAGGDAPHFSDKTIPDSRDYDSLPTQVAVWNIPASDMVMTVDIDVNWSRPYLTLQSYVFSDVNGGDGDGILEPGESIEFSCTVFNDWKEATSASMSLAVDDETLDITTGFVSLGAIPSGGTSDNNGSPLVFDIPIDYTPRVDSFFVEIETDAGQYVVVLPIEQNVGHPEFLLVDDDNGDSYESYYNNLWLEKRIPATRWDKSINGTPDLPTLAEYETVVWFTGDYRVDPLTSDDITAMKSYLDGGGDLFLTGQGIAAQLAGFDPNFLYSYLRAEYVTGNQIPLLTINPGADLFAEFGDSLALAGYEGALNQSRADRMNAVNGGVAELNYYNSADLGAVSYTGSYKLIFFGFGFEGISDSPIRFARQAEVMDLIMNFFSITVPTGFPEVVDLSVGPGSSSNLIDHTPDISWGYYDEGAADQSDYQIQVGSDNDWSVAEMWDYTAGFGSETSVEYAGIALEDGQTCFYRVRVHNGLQWSNWMAGDFHLNKPPGVPTGLSPTGMLGIFSGPLVLEGNNSFDYDGGEMTYDFQLFADEQLINLVAEELGVEAGTDKTSVEIAVSIIEGQNYYWRMNCFDSYEYGAWSDPVTFKMGGFEPGDANGDGTANVGDAVFLINFVFKSGPAPDPLSAGDANADCQTNVGDAVYLINFVFKSGPPPMVGCSK